ncbi:unnamed protein product [Closterium sp. Yama58-4]|nr:unnamed protein product [Closterium sp. Yama58-4]
MAASLLASALFLLSSLISAILFSPRSPPLLLALPGKCAGSSSPRSSRPQSPARAPVAGGCGRGSAWVFRPSSLQQMAHSSLSPFFVPLFPSAAAHPSLRMVPPAQSDLPAEALLGKAVSGAAHGTATSKGDGSRHPLPPSPDAGLVDAGVGGLGEGGRGIGVVLPAVDVSEGGEREEQGQGQAQEEQRQGQAELQQQEEGGVGRDEEEWSAAVERVVEEAVSDAFSRAQFLLASLDSVRRAGRAAQKAFSDRSFVALVEEEMVFHFGGEGVEGGGEGGEKSGEKGLRGVDVGVGGRVGEEARRRAEAVVRTVVVMMGERGEEGVESARMGAAGEEEEGEGGEEGEEVEEGEKQGGEEGRKGAAGGGAIGRRFRLAERLKGLGDVARDKVWDMADSFLSRLRAAGQKVVSAEEFLAARARYAAVRVRDAGKRVFDRVVESGRAAREDAEAAQDAVIATEAVQMEHGGEGERGGEGVGESEVGQMGRAWDAAKGRVEEGAEKLRGEVKEGAEKLDEVQEGAEKLLERVKEGAEKLPARVKEGAEVAWEEARERGSKMGEKVKEGAEKAWEEAREEGSRVGGKMREKAGEGWEAVEGAGEKMREGVRREGGGEEEEGEMGDGVWMEVQGVRFFQPGGAWAEEAGGGGGEGEGKGVGDWAEAAGGMGGGLAEWGDELQLWLLAAATVLAALLALILQPLLTYSMEEAAALCRGPSSPTPYHKRPRSSWRLRRHSAPQSTAPAAPGTPPQAPPPLATHPEEATDFFPSSTEG